MIIYKLFRFDSAHYLPNVPAGHPCGGMHGQTGTHTGWVIDYTAIKELAGPWVKKLDHQVINQLDGLENPTAENICLWFWRNLQPELPGLFRLELNETPDSGVIYEG